MFERFTDRARRAVVLAQQEARDLNHDYIGTEHLLLGLIDEGRGVAAKALEQMGVALADVRRDVEGTIGRGRTPVTRKYIPFTPRAKKVLELSLREALKLGHNYIGTEHILLGLLRQAEGVAAQILVRRGVKLPAAREAVIGLLQSTVAEAAGGGAERHARMPFSSEVRIRPEMPSDPACPSCHAALAGSSAYRILDVPEAEGEGKARVLFLFCRACGHTIDDLILPDER